MAAIKGVRAAVARVMAMTTGREKVPRSIDHEQGGAAIVESHLDRPGRRRL